MPDTFHENGSPMIATEITFAKQFSGYDREQVDRYVNRLSGAYQTAFTEYNELLAAYKELKQRNDLLEDAASNRPDPDLVTKVLMDSEATAQKRIADAQLEAQVIINAANVIAEDTRADAIATMEKAKQTLAEAGEMEERARLRSQKIVDDAITAATQVKAIAKGCLLQIDDIIAQTVSDLQQMK